VVARRASMGSACSHETEVAAAVSEQSCALQARGEDSLAAPPPLGSAVASGPGCAGRSEEHGAEDASLEGLRAMQEVERGGDPADDVRDGVSEVGSNASESSRDSKDDDELSEAGSDTSASSSSVGSQDDLDGSSSCSESEEGSEDGSSTSGEDGCGSEDGCSDSSTEEGGDSGSEAEVDESAEAASPQASGLPPWDMLAQRLKRALEL